MMQWWRICHHYITKSARPSLFFLCALKNMGRPGYEATSVVLFVHIHPCLAGNIDSKWCVLTWGLVFYTSLSTQLAQQTVVPIEDVFPLQGQFCTLKLIVFEVEAIDSCPNWRGVLIIVTVYPMINVVHCQFPISDICTHIILLSLNKRCLTHSSSLVYTLLEVACEEIGSNRSMI